MSGRAARAVLFDLDGTLLDTNYFHVLAWWRALDDAGVHRPMAELHRLMGMGGSELLMTVVGEEDEALSESHGRYLSEFGPLIRTLPGAAEIVRHVHSRDALVVVVTSAQPDELPRLLGTLDCDQFIDEVVHGESAERAKPAPDLFLTALERVGLPPTSVIALGDTVWDVQAATRAGIGCVAVETGGIPRQDLRQAGALAVYTSCADLLSDVRRSPLAGFLSD